jgi:hypothetical protein
MYPLEIYYLNQAGRGLTPSEVICPVYAAPLTLRTGGKILTDIAENRSPELSPKVIVSKHVTESVQNLKIYLRGKRTRRVSRKKAKRARVIKRDIFS